MSDSSATPTTRKNAIPTNLITYKGRSMPARIDPEARIAYVVEMMAAAFGTKEHHITLCLRDEGDVLVTQNNLPSKVSDHNVLKLVSSPTTEALAVVTSLNAPGTLRTSQDSNAVSPDQPAVLPLKLALFNLQKYIKEEDFAVEFMLRGGMKMLVKLLEQHEGGLSGNSLAYALQGVRGIMEFENGWNDLSDTFVDRILEILVSSAQPNVIRPATAIIRKLVISNSPSAAKGKGKTGKGKEKAADGEASNRFGFDRVYVRMEQVGSTLKEEGGSAGRALVLKIVIKRLEGTGDLELVAQSLGLLTACLRSAHQESSRHYWELVIILESLGLRRYVSRLMPTCANNIVEPQILNFQARYATILHNRRHRPVRPAQDAQQEKMLSEIWHAGRLDNNKIDGTPKIQSGGERTWEGWRRIGLWPEFEGDDVPAFLMEVDLFRDVGELGLECLHWFAMHDENFYNLVIEQEARPFDRRCPIGKASAECVRILCEHYKVSQAGHHAPSSFQVFLLNFHRLHSLVLRFFMRMWHDSESRLPDFPRVSLLVHSQIRLSLNDEANKTWLNLEHDFQETEYRTIRDRQMELMDREDGMSSKPAIKELRETLSKEVYDMISEQRIGCMLQGGWFNVARVISPGITATVKAYPAKPVRFMRLSPNRHTLAWADFAQRTANPPFESLRERIELSNVTDIRSQTGCAVNSRSPNITSKLSFSLMTGSEISLMDVDAIHAAQLAEWTDGLRVLRGEIGMSTQDSANFVHILTELALKVRLLDVTGDGVEIPDKVSFGPAPQSVDFWFAK
ncbi:hypothetical protein BCR39DRAFT_521383 [Naematelia encephala]|uniref:ELMO domain-containing protein n=1 Tax=Naematelia encephala TaxID=71784 RepID=A0A1Y2BE68_9TREE|nr:hypothetical protein BCR39DRAFT_521383 [Naematelia encephala]